MPPGCALHSEIERAAAGEPLAQAGLYEAYSRLVRAWLQRGFSFDPETTRDLVQDVFLHLYRNGARALRSYQPRAGASFESWLRIVCRNEALALLRRRQARRAIQETAQLSAAEQVADGRVGHPLDRLRLAGFLDRLSERERGVAMAAMEELTYQEAARRCGVTVSHLGVMLYRLRRRWLAETAGDCKKQSSRRVIRKEVESPRG